MKRIIISALCITGALLLAASCGNSEKKAAAAAAEQARLDSLEQVEIEKRQQEAMATLATLPEEPVFDIVTNMGTIKVKLYSKTPKHRENFAKLALSGYYNGLLFHRVINNFMIQAGDPLTKDPENAAKFGTGGPGYTIPAEFVPEYTHKKGALAAARRGDSANPMKESSGSQFYLVQDERACSSLNGDYTVFGETISGLDVIDRIAGVTTDQRDRPVSDVKIVAIRLDQDALPKSE
jgi:cyclophilin family peptidyl-prolyl cis-trans isomerase